MKIKEKMQTDRRRKKKYEDSDNEITDFTDYAELDLSVILNPYADFEYTRFN